MIRKPSRGLEREDLIVFKPVQIITQNGPRYLKIYPPQSNIKPDNRLYLDKKCTQIDDSFTPGNEVSQTGKFSRIAEPTTTSKKTLSSQDTIQMTALDIERILKD